MQLAAAGGGQQLSPVPPQQPQAHRRLPELQDRRRLRLADEAAIPSLGQAEFGHRGFDVNRRQVAARGELDAFGADTVKQPQYRLQDPAVDDSARQASSLVSPITEFAPEPLIYEMATSRIRL